jgi:hypothetical protein
VSRYSWDELSVGRRRAIVVALLLVAVGVAWVILVWVWPPPAGPFGVWSGDDVRCYRDVDGFALRSHRIAFSMLSLVVVSIAGMMVAGALSRAIIGCLAWLVVPAALVVAVLALGNADMNCGS